jgi:nitrite reductase/ring-hydroxylating ferredoxin subunit
LVTPARESSRDRLSLVQRFPMPLSPNGWFAVLRSNELGRKKAVPVRAFNRELVAFRDAAGRASVLDAYCPHLGAHLGYGGKVVRGAVECPFHEWRFDGEGRCVHATGPAGCDARPPRSNLRAWPVAEVEGVIFVWHHAAGEPPSWQLPAFPKARNGARYSSPMELRFRVGAHVQEIRENIGDETHFSVIHRWPIHSDVEFDDHGPFADLRFTSSVGVGKRRMYFDAEVQMLGPGLQHLRVFGFAQSRVSMLMTPIDSESTDLRLLVYAADLFGLPMSRFLHALIVRQITSPDVDLEHLIWNHKIYLERPVFLPHEQTQRKIRNWYQQFYT